MRGPGVSSSMSMMSIKDRAMSKFNNCRRPGDFASAANLSHLSMDDIDPETQARWEARKIGPFNFDVDDEIQV